MSSITTSGRPRRLVSFGPYFADRPPTVWGDAIDFSPRGVREWAIQNAVMWIRDYRVDGLRLDAVHAIDDEQSPVHVLRELRDRVGALVISEIGHDDSGRSRSGGMTRSGSTRCTTISTSC